MAHIGSVHSYKSFIAPDKIAEVLCHFLDSPWSAIASKMGEKESDIKSRLKELVRWRNRIAHEADINPTLGGIDLWPIFEQDVREAIEFLGSLGQSIADVIVNQA